MLGYLLPLLLLLGVAGLGFFGVQDAADASASATGEGDSLLGRLLGSWMLAAVVYVAVIVGVIVLVAKSGILNQVIRLIRESAAAFARVVTFGMVR